MARRRDVTASLRSLKGVDPRNLNASDFDASEYHDGDYDYGESRSWSSDRDWEDYDDEE